jgi:hydroxymethylbilane synthase
MAIKQITIGSRGSALALWQTHHVESLLRATDPELVVNITIIKTTGDKILTSSLAEIGGKGAFTKELEDALLAGEIDLAVHSLKDLPTTLPDGLMVAAILERAQAEDVFLSNTHSAKLLELPKGAVIATGSLRRRAQILARRPDYNIVDIRGNVPTRIEKLRNSTWSGMILAGAGIRRLGLEQNIAHTIPLSDMLPAPGQGAIAIEIAKNKPEVDELIKKLHHEATAVAVNAEREVLAALGGGCQLPLGTYGRIENGELHLDACIARLDGKELLKSSLSGKPTEGQALGKKVAEDLLAKGGFAILESLPDSNPFSSSIGTM